MTRFLRYVLAASAGAFVAGALLLCAKAPAAPPGSDPAAPVFGDPFWEHWGDGKAELAGYDLVFPRYGELRKGTAVTVFVTETFSSSLRVKSDPGKHPKTDEYPVLKLNLVEDFSTGIYDYNLLTSAFVALTPVNGRPSGSATKVSFSSQEWCGNAFAQLLFDASFARYSLHSYFDGEADQSRVVAAPADALAADALLLWARGLAWPLLQPGERREVALVPSLETSRLLHRPVALGRATLSRDREAMTVVVPAGSFAVERRTVEIAGGPTWRIDVETAEPHRLVAWETTDGQHATLLASDRLEYWKLHGEKDLPALAKLGLKPRPPRTP